LSTLIAITGGCIDLRRREIRRQGKVLTLTPIEYRLIAHLTGRPGEVHTHRELLAAVWGYSDGVRTRTLASTLRRLRMKVEEEASSPRHLQTVAGIGYRFDAGADLAGGGPFTVGLDARVQELSSQLRTHRLVSVTGPVGIGKTWLAAAASAAWPTRTYFVDLVPASDAITFLGTVAAGLDISAFGAVSESALAERIGQWVVAHPSELVVLDNFENVLGCAPLLESWIEADDGATVLVTSRELLGLKGELRFDLSALPDDAAMALFAHHGGEARPGFSLDDSTRANVLITVNALDNHPLSIVLAASRLDVVGLEEMRPIMEIEPDFLKGRVGLADRHRSLAVAVEGSLRSLTEEQRRALMAWSVFGGGFDLRAAATVADLTSSRAADILSVLQRRSMVQGTALEASGRRAFRLYLAIRQAVRGRVASSLDLEDARHRHLNWVLEVGGSAPGQVDGERARFGLVNDALAACQWALPRVPAKAARILVDYRRPLMGVLSVDAAGALYQRALEALGEEHPGLRAELIVERTALTSVAVVSDQGLEALKRAVALADSTDDAALQVRCRLQLSNFIERLGRVDDAIAILRDAVARCERNGDAASLASALSSLAGTLRLRRRHAESEQLLLRALALQRDLGTTRGLMIAHMLMGAVLGDQGRHLESEPHIDCAISLAEALQSRLALNVNLLSRADCMVATDRLDEAELVFAEAGALAADSANQHCEAMAQAGLASLAIRRRELDDAEKLSRAFTSTGPRAGFGRQQRPRLSWDSSAWPPVSGMAPAPPSPGSASWRPPATWAGMTG